MKINSIKISNMLSFEHNNDVDKCHEIKFNKGINIIIGPNGSGKSNFLEILNQFVNRFLFLPVEYSESSRRSHKIKGTPADFSGSIRLVGDQQINIPTNRNSTSHVQRIKIEIGLSDADTTNLLFILKNQVELNKIAKKYTKNYPLFPNVKADDLQKQKSIILLFEDVSNYHRLSNMTQFQNDVEPFISFYIEFFGIIQKIIEVANKYESQNWLPLKNTVATLSSYRNYNLFEPIFTVQPSGGDEISSIKLNLANQKFLHAEEKEPVIFNYIRNVIGYDFHDFLINRGGISQPDPNQKFDNQTFLKINKILDELMHIKMHILWPDKTRWIFHFDFLNTKTNEVIPFNQLSAGEKGLVHIILTIFGHDLEKGCMIIDEPEIHLHPQMQETLLELIKKMSQDHGVQFIIATHSPLFVNSKTIYGVQRFYNENGFTKTINPCITESERDLSHILTLTNSSKIFFSEKVILVEGDSDDYFYKTYFEYYRNNKNKENISLEFLNINGSGNIKKWREFLNKYKITSFYIGDTDNLLQDYVSANAMSWTQKFGKPLLRNKLNDIKLKHNHDYQQMMSEINQLISNNIFLLSDGSLENYLEVHVGKIPDFEDVINFCHNFDSWLNSNSSDPILKESEVFFDKITS